MKRRGTHGDYAFLRTTATQRLLDTWYEQVDAIRQARGKNRPVPLVERPIIYAAPKVAQARS